MKMRSFHEISSFGNHKESCLLEEIFFWWNLLTLSISRCVILDAKDAEDNHLALVHTKNHIDLIKTISYGNTASKRKKMAAKFNSIYFNEGSSEAAYLAAGSVIEVCLLKVGMSLIILFGSKDMHWKCYKRSLYHVWEVVTICYHLSL